MREWIAIACVLCPAVWGAAAAAGGIPKVMSPEARLELVHEGFEGAEGPVSDGHGGLYFNDVKANKAYQLRADGALVVWRTDTHGANGQFRTLDGRLLVAEGAGKRVLEFSSDGTQRVLADAASGQPLREPNDLIADEKGRVYFTDPAPRPSPTELPKERGNLDFIAADGRIQVVDAEIVRPNGLVLSVDGKTLFVDDTEGEAIYAFARHADGSLGKRREFVHLAEPERGPAGPRSHADGMTIDSAGRLYVTSAAGVQVVSPEGRLLGIIRTPALVRNVAFAGSDRRDLYMTSARALYRIRLIARGPATRLR